MLREPYFPISLEATKINNITHDMVRGKTIDTYEAFAFAQYADLT